MQIDKTNREQQKAYELIVNTNSSFFLTGRAGTGKTTFLKNIQENGDKRFVTVAPTGVAAILAGGETIHSMFGLPLGVLEPGTVGKINSNKLLALKYADTIIIDEVSMTRCDTIDAIDSTLRSCLHSSLPFGGKQMVFVGDVFQLAPVVQSADAPMLRDLYKTDNFYFYKAKVFSRINLPKIEFVKVYRQSDSSFVKILEHVRNNRITASDLAQLNARVAKPSAADGLVITLASLNKTVDGINHQHLAEIQSAEHVYVGTTEGTFSESRYPVEKELKLKVGAQVMFARNDKGGRWVNGTLGKVTKLGDNIIEVTTDDGKSYKVSPCTWESIAYEYNKAQKKMEKKIKGTFTQYPLRLAWAITIHKSQGMTFDKMMLDLSRGIFADAQLYVALSRVRSIDDLYLSQQIKASYAHTAEEILEFTHDYNDKEKIDDEIALGKNLYKPLKEGDYDEVARQYLLMCEKKMQQGKTDEAMNMAKAFLDNVICDDTCYGCIKSVPATHDVSNGLKSRFIAAMLALYAEQYNEALVWIDDVIERHKCYEALYIKVRCLARMGKWAEADEVNSQMNLEPVIKQGNMKILYEVAIVNNVVGDGAAYILQYILDSRPNYSHGIITLRGMMKDEHKKLDAGEDNSLTIMFDSDASDEEFGQQLDSMRQSSPKTVKLLMKAIRNMQFEDN